MAKNNPVKCPICGEKFYREEEGYKKKGNRYYHIKCYESAEEELSHREAIHNRCKNMFGVNYSKQKIDSQINKMLKDGKTLSGINGTLFYWYDVKNNSWDKANYGINIVNYVYGEAADYFYTQTKNKTRNLGVDVSCYINPKVEEITINLKPIEKPKRLNLFDIR